MKIHRLFALSIPFAVAVAMSAAAATPELPTLKSGQWDMTTTSSTAASAPRKSTICLDASTQKAMLDMGTGMQKEMCPKFALRHEGSRWITDAECRLGASNIRSHAVMTMQGDSAFRTEATSTYDPPLLKDVRESTTVVEAKYAGACRDGMTPGDVLLPNGQKLNLRQMQSNPAPKVK